MTEDNSVPETSTQAAWRGVWRSLVVRGALLILGIGVLALILGFVFQGTPGLAGAGIGFALAAVFLLVSIVIMYFGRNMSLTVLGGLFAIGFLFKAFIFMIIVWNIRNEPWLSGPVAFFTVVAAVVATSVLEILTITRTKIPYVDPDAR